MTYHLWVPIEGSAHMMTDRTIELDGIPYPGVVIGALTVAKVMLLQGDLDDGPHSIEMEPVNERHAETLQKNGWTRETFE